MPASKSIAKKPATYDDANLLLRLYEMRREERMRQARDWFAKNFHASTVEEFQILCPLRSEENASYRMVVSYWDMAASFVTGGILHKELFIQNSRELLLVWERISRIVPEFRKTFDSQNLSKNLETVANAMQEYRLPDSAFGVS